VARGFAEPPEAEDYLLANAGVVAALIDALPAANGAGLALADIRVSQGRIAAIRPAGSPREPGLPALDLRRGLVFPAFADMHTHLDKGHIAPRRPNPDGSFGAALAATLADREANWRAEDVERRMEFSLRAAHAHGTAAIRTHLDSVPPQHGITWEVFERVRERWAGRVALEGVALMGADHLLDEGVAEAVARRAKAAGGLMGGAVAVHPQAREAVFAAVRAATRHGIDLDLHLDETEDPASTSLRFLAEAVLETGFPGRVVAGHCCSLARQRDAEIDRTLDLVARAGIAIVSLPMCNLYLQDRHALGNGTRRTPRWRGVTLLHEMRARGIPVAVASDNTRDPFYAYGDLDALEVLREATRILHLDHPHDGWAAAVTATPAALMGLDGAGRIAEGRPADLVLTRARSYDELFARPQSDRVVLRAGRPIDTTLPDYSELDDLMEART